MGWVGNATPRLLYPREIIPGTRCIGGWVNPRNGLGGCGKSHTHRDSIPGPSSPERVAVETEISRAHIFENIRIHKVDKNKPPHCCDTKNMP